MLICRCMVDWWYRSFSFISILIQTIFTSDFFGNPIHNLHLASYWQEWVCHAIYMVVFFFFWEGILHGGVGWSFWEDLMYLILECHFFPFFLVYTWQDDYKEFKVFCNIFWSLPLFVSNFVYVGGLDEYHKAFPHLLLVCVFVFFFWDFSLPLGWKEVSWRLFAQNMR